MTQEYYARIRVKLYGGYKPNPFAELRTNRAGVRGPIQGTDEEFSQIVYELTRGELNKRNEEVVCEFIARGRRSLVRFMDESRFTVVRTKGAADRTFIIVTPCTLSPGDLLNIREMPIAELIFDSLKIKEIYTRVAGEYKREELRLETEKAAEERKINRESSIETTVKTIELSKSGKTVMVRGLHNIDAMVKFGFIPGLVVNPDNWIDAEDFPGMLYRHAKSGIELLLTAREKFRPIEELNRLELYFLVNRSDDDPGLFGKMRKKYRETKEDGSPYLMREFHYDLISMVRYPEELKCRTEEDLGLMADEVGQVIDRRQELDKGILPYEAVFTKDTQAIIDHILKNKTPATEIRKALDYFEYTGMIDSNYRETLDQAIKSSLCPVTINVGGTDDLLHSKRVKEIVTAVLKSLSPEQLTPKSITVALSPYVIELGFGKLVKIRERILQLRELMQTQERNTN
jgi:hypothetical protein